MTLRDANSHREDQTFDNGETHKHHLSSRPKCISQQPCGHRRLGTKNERQGLSNKSLSLLAKPDIRAIFVLRNAVQSSHCVGRIEFRLMPSTNTENLPSALLPRNPAVPTAVELFVCGQASCSASQLLAKTPRRSLRRSLLGRLQLWHAVTPRSMPEPLCAHLSPLFPSFMDTT